MNRLSNADRSRVIACLCEGNSIRATERITGITKKAITRLSVELGEACEKFADKIMVSLPCTEIQCDEIWAFCYAKEKNVPTHMRGQAGDIWTWVAIDPKTKLIPCWFVGDRTTMNCYRFLRNLSPRLANRIQISSDGLRAYTLAMKGAFHGSPVDYGKVVKMYGDPIGEGKYSPNVCTGARREIVFGCPDREKICTSHVERQNLSMRMQMRRFTRLTNGFSKKLENHRLAVAVHFVHYNFARVHASLRITPAMAAGLTDHVWELSEIVALLEAEEMAVTE